MIAEPIQSSNSDVAASVFNDLIGQEASNTSSTVQDMPQPLTFYQAFTQLLFGREHSFKFSSEEYNIMLETLFKDQKIGEDYSSIFHQSISVEFLHELVLRRSQECREDLERIVKEGKELYDPFEILENAKKTKKLEMRKSMKNQAGKKTKPRLNRISEAPQNQQDDSNRTITNSSRSVSGQNTISITPPNNRPTRGAFNIPERPDQDSSEEYLSPEQILTKVDSPDKYPTIKPQTQKIFDEEEDNERFRQIYNELKQTNQEQNVDNQNNQEEQFQIINIENDEDESSSSSSERSARLGSIIKINPNSKQNNKILKLGTQFPEPQRFEDEESFKPQFLLEFIERTTEKKKQKNIESYDDKDLEVFDGIMYRDEEQMHEQYNQYVEQSKNQSKNLNHNLNVFQQPKDLIENGYDKEQQMKKDKKVRLFSKLQRQPHQNEQASSISSIESLHLDAELKKELLEDMMNSQQNQKQYLSEDMMTPSKKSIKSVDLKQNFYTRLFTPTRKIKQMRTELRYRVMMDDQTTLPVRVDHSISRIQGEDDHEDLSDHNTSNLLAAIYGKKDENQEKEGNKTVRFHGNQNGLKIKINQQNFDVTLRQVNFDFDDVKKDLEVKIVPTVQRTFNDISLISMPTAKKEKNEQVETEIQKQLMLTLAKKSKYRKNPKMLQHLNNETLKPRMIDRTNWYKNTDFLGQINENNQGVMVTVLQTEEPLVPQNTQITQSWQSNFMSSQKTNNVNSMTVQPTQNDMYYHQQDFQQPQQVIRLQQFNSNQFFDTSPSKLLQPYSQHSPYYTHSQAQNQSPIDPHSGITGMRLDSQNYQTILDRMRVPLRNQPGFNQQVQLSDLQKQKQHKPNIYKLSDVQIGYAHEMSKNKIGFYQYTKRIGMSKNEKIRFFAGLIGSRNEFEIVQDHPEYMSEIFVWKVEE